MRTVSFAFSLFGDKGGDSLHRPSLLRVCFDSHVPTLRRKKINLHIRAQHYVGARHSVAPRCCSLGEIIPIKPCKSSLNRLQYPLAYRLLWALVIRGSKARQDTAKLTGLFLCKLWLCRNHN